jgi:hypothetical protein
MPIELAGISNVYEFYSEHYLQTVFEGDVQELFAEWREAEKAGTVPPNRKLAKVGTAWRKLSADYGAERNDGDRLLIFRRFSHDFLAALGYVRDLKLVPDAEEKLVPVLARRTDHAGHDRVWVVEVPSASGEDFADDPLTTRFRCEQFENIEAAADISTRRKDTAETAINKGIFALRHPPRFVVLLSMSQAVLIDREKWGDSRLMKFDFAEIFGQSDPTTIGAMTALLLSTSLAPDSGTALIDRIDEESHRHAYGVSQDLKFSLREAIELLGNEAAELIVEKRRAQQKGVFTGANALDATVLSAECLRYMYRLLFLFYIEARPDLGFAPMNDAAYASGYSLNSLRELELVPLDSDEDRNGHYISDTIDTLFRIVFEGTPSLTTTGSAMGEAFAFHPVRARLFAPESVGAYLGGIRFRNSVMQRIVELLSLSRDTRSGRGGRGRISYAQLGISQLGAVYESLLSFTGFFADEDLIEVKPADKAAPGPLEAAFFAPARRAGDFTQSEIVYDVNAPKILRQGTFIYRLAGRNRENSASYYTPEPLARVLVKHALKELLHGKKADDILKLRVVEPAMGSAAFLVEVVNQLTDKYLELKQAELDLRIPHEERGDVERRVRAYIADRNVFGVDLNPIAVELGQISLWLDCLHKGGFAPWFDDQVHNGNSLVGARRAVQPARSLTAKREDDRWHKRKPREIGWAGGKREVDEIWHFLLPDFGMAAYDQDIVQPLAPVAWQTLTEWRREFMQPFDQIEVANLIRLSAVIEALFEEVADRLVDIRSAVNDDIAIWPAKAASNEKHIDFQEKLKRLANFHGAGVKNAVAWRRLRTAMDAWCSLWFWPVDKANLLPSRATFISDLALVLEGKMGGQVLPQNAFATGSAQGRLFETVYVPGKADSSSLFEPEDRAAALHKVDLFGDVDIDKLVATSSWLPIAMGVAHKQKFMHFELEFADIMRERGGFDLVIGNPPWLKPRWTDSQVLSEKEPALGIRNISADSVEKLKPGILAADPFAPGWYLDSYVEVGGLQSFLSSLSTFPFVGTGQPNLYKCFIDLSFRITAPKGFSALIHQDNHLLDPNGADFRRSWYLRIRRHYNFINAISARMFADVGHYERFSLNVYGGEEAEIGFDHIGTLLLPSMIDDSYEHDGVGSIPNIKRPSGGWDTRGHRKRIVRIDRLALESFAAVIEDENAPYDTTRFLFPFSTETLAIFRSFAAERTSFSEGAKPFQMRRLWDESVATKRDHIIESKVSTPTDVSEVILTGPLLYVGNPFYKSFDVTGNREREIDLQLIPDDYIPRTAYSRLIDKQSYQRGIAPLGWDHAKQHTDLYRIAFRRRLNLNMEHTLIGALITPGVAHVNTVESLAFEDEDKLVGAYPLWISLPFDFLVKATGLADFRESSLRFFPWASVSDTAKHRALRLSCLTEAYSDLWNRQAGKLHVLPWSSSDPRLLVEVDHADWSLDPWDMVVGLRSDFARRQALVEIDVLVAQALGLSLDQLIEMYRTQFHVLDENERGTWYDMNGSIVWTCSKGLSGVGYRKKDGKKPSGKEWLELYANLEAGRVLECEIDVDFLPSGPTTVKRTFVAPFTTCDREVDYRRAWAFFEAHAKQKAA